MTEVTLWSWVRAEEIIRRKTRKGATARKAATFIPRLEYLWWSKENGKRSCWLCEYIHPDAVTNPVAEARYITKEPAAIRNLLKLSDYLSVIILCHDSFSVDETARALLHVRADPTHIFLLVSLQDLTSADGEVVRIVQNGRCTRDANCVASDARLRQGYFPGPFWAVGGASTTNATASSPGSPGLASALPTAPAQILALSRSYPCPEVFEASWLAWEIFRRRFVTEQQLRRLLSATLSVARVHDLLKVLVDQGYIKLFTVDPAGFAKADVQDSPVYVLDKTGRSLMRRYLATTTCKSAKHTLPALVTPPLSGPHPLVFHDLTVTEFGLRIQAEIAARDGHSVWYTEWQITMQFGPRISSATKQRRLLRPDVLLDAVGFDQPNERPFLCRDG